MGEESTEKAPSLTIRGIKVFRDLLDRAEQQSMLKAIRAAVAQAPLFSPTTPAGRKMSVQMTSAGNYGWVSDRAGYRYDARHPSGVAWPPIPLEALRVWAAVSGSERVPECCLINYYTDGARMGLHQDKDEADFNEPVVSISLGDDALFRIGQAERGGKTESLWLTSGDVVVMTGAARLLYHGVDLLRPGSSRLLAHGGRINLTLRVVT